jgi:Protein of unknown function (DUF2439)
VKDAQETIATMMSMSRPQQQVQQQQVQQQQQQQQVQPQQERTQTHQVENHQQLVATQQRTQSNQFACLFTHQKTQKRKKWRDGRFVLQSSGRGKLYDACPPPGAGNPCLAEVELQRNEINSLLQNCQTVVEAEKYLIQLEGAWTEPTNHAPEAPTGPKVSNSMQKLMSRKFRKPGSFKPPNPQLQQNGQSSNHLGKRRRPLQPGELVRQHYGDCSVAPPVNLVDWGAPASNSLPARQNPSSHALHQPRFSNQHPKDTSHDNQQPRSHGWNHLQDPHGYNENFHPQQNVPIQNHSHPAEPSSADGGIQRSGAGAGNRASHTNSFAPASASNLSNLSSSTVALGHGNAIGHHHQAPEVQNGMVHSSIHQQTGYPSASFGQHQKAQNANGPSSSNGHPTASAGSGNGFLGNSFDPSSFYGAEEEEESDDGDDDDDLFAVGRLAQSKSNESTNKAATYLSSQTTNEQNLANNDKTGGTTGTATAPTTAPVKQATRSALTNKDIFNIFGVDESQSQEEEEEEEEEDDDDGVQGPKAVSDSPEPAPAAAPEFTLPPVDSSSSESSDDEE